MPRWIEKINQPASENLTDREKKETSDEFPAFVPENAARLVEEARAQKNTVSSDVEADHQKKDGFEYDFRIADRYQEETFLLRSIIQATRARMIFEIISEML